MAVLDLLSGIIVLEVAEGVAGPMCGKVLADLGATVTRVEPPGGDWLRRLEPEKGGADAIYQQLNANKKILTLDLTTPEGQAQMRALARMADVCIVGQRQVKLPKLGLDYAAIKESVPGLIYCHVSGWGSTGPKADHAASELCIQVVAGLTRYLGTRGGAPVRQGFDLVSVDTGVAATQAILAALLWRATSGEGQYVEVSMLSTAVALMQWDIAAESGPDRWEGRQLNAQEWPSDHGFQCADTRCLIDLRGNEQAWPSLLRDIGYPELAEDPRFTTLKGRDLSLTELPRLTAERLVAWSFDDIERLVRDKYDGTIVPMLDLPQVIRHPQVQHIGVIEAGEIPRVRFPMDVR
jgi:crotonobetainyl-CoA:carnitine CoA-transferase CaiB-like acyl-CoA transferase